MSTSISLDSTTPRPEGSVAKWVALTLFTLVSMVGLIDFFILGALINPIKTAFTLTDEQLGRIALVYTIANVLTAPIFGFFGDRFSRKWLIIFGLVLWSLATIGGGLSYGLGSLLIWRALVGAGESSLRSLIPSWLGDLFGPKNRGSAFALFTGPGPAAYMIAYVVGGQVGEIYGWHTAFFVAGAPGLLLAVALFFLREPSRGHADGHVTPPAKPTLRDTVTLLRNPNYILILLGQTTYSFSLGGISFWGSAYFHRAFGATNHDATHFFGMGYLYPGVLSTIAGGFAAAWLQRRTRAGYAIWFAAMSALAVVFLIPALLADNIASAEKWIWYEIIFATGGGAVLTPLIFNTVPLPLRATALALFTTFSGVGYTILQTEGMGLISDRYGLHAALFVVPALTSLSVVFWLVLIVRQLRHEKVPAVITVESPEPDALAISVG